MKNVFPQRVAAALMLVAGVLSGAASRGQDLTRDSFEHGVPRYSVRSWLQLDATLRGITFVDADRGWAVGDRGVILFSDSGGDAWEAQNSHTTASLQDVHFLDPQRGVAVGGHYESDTQTSRGVVLITSSGGRAWERVETDLPLLRSVHVQADGTLWAAGDFSTIHMASVFLSNDGGRNWMAANAESIARAASSSGPADGPATVLGSEGILRHFPSLLEAATPVLADPLLRSVHGDREDRVAVGVSNRLYLSRDGGRKWQAVAADLAEPHDFLAAAVVEGVVYAAGRPGNRIRRVDTDGTVRTHTTPLSTPLRSVCFFDAQRGWAVGAFGAVVATRDAGRTWRLQRGDDRRAAMLVVGQHTADVPWSVVAHESLERGRRIAVGTLPAPASADVLAPDPATLGSQLACGLGGGETFTWRIDAATGQLDTDSVRLALLAYRPRVLVLSDAIEPAHRRHWIRLASELGVQRVLEPTAKAYAEWTLHSRALLPRTGALLSDLQSDSAALLQSGRMNVGDRHFRRTFDAILPLGRSITDPWDALVAAGPAELRKIDTATNRHTLQILQARGGEEPMIARMLADGDRNGSYLQRLKLTLRQTPSDNRERLARRVLAECRRSDQSHLYQQTLQVIQELLPQAPLGKWAALRLQAMASSSEWQLLARATRHHESQALQAATSVRLSPFAQSPPAPSPRAPENASTIQQASAVSEVIVTPQYAADPPVTSGRENGEPDLVWDFDPRVALVHRAGQPSPESPAESSPALAPLAESSPALAPLSGVLKRAAENAGLQDWGRLIDSTSASIVPVARTPKQPFLDGILDEPCWTAAQAVSTADGYEVRFAYDARHLYWSASGTAPPAAAAPASDPSQRMRDADLDAAARIVLKVDIGGDLLTAFGLEVDRFGRTRDTCDGFTRWQPMWFVDTREADGRWTVEAAVRRSDLSSLPPVLGSTWKVSLRSCEAEQGAWQEAFARSHDWSVIRFE